MAGLKPEVVRQQVDPNTRTYRGPGGGPGFLAYQAVTEDIQAEMEEPFLFPNIPVGLSVTNFLVRAIAEYTGAATDFQFWLRATINPSAEAIVVGDFYNERSKVMTRTAEGCFTYSNHFPVLIQRGERITLRIDPLHEGYAAGVTINKLTVDVHALVGGLYTTDLNAQIPIVNEDIFTRQPYKIQLLEEDSNGT